jgi:hypothetical protein
VLSNAATFIKSDSKGFIEPMVVSILYILFFTIYFGNMYFQSDVKNGLTKLELQNRKSIYKIFFYRSLTLLLMGMSGILVLQIPVLLISLCQSNLIKIFTVGFITSIVASIIVFALTLSLTIMFASMTSSTFSSIPTLIFNIAFLISPFLGSISVQYQGEAINYLDDKFTAASFTEINNDHLKSALLISNGDYDDNDIRRINKLEFNDERVFYRDAGDEYLANENVLDFEKVNFINFMQPLGQLMDSLADEETSNTVRLESNLISGHNEINFDVLEKVLTENKGAVLESDFAKNLDVKNISDIIAVLKVMDQFHKDIYLKNNKLIFGYFGAQYPSYGCDSDYSFEKYVNTIFFESSYLLKFGEIFYGNSKDEPSLYSISNLARIDVANLKSSYWKSPFIWANDFYNGMINDSNYYFYLSAGWGPFFGNAVEIRKISNETVPYTFQKYEVVGQTKITNYGFEAGLFIFLTAASYFPTIIIFKKRILV